MNVLPNDPRLADMSVSQIDWLVENFMDQANDMEKMMDESRKKGRSVIEAVNPLMV
jgi:hypothetical protein